MNFKVFCYSVVLWLIYNPLQTQSISCAELNSSQIKLITFDVFAALMSTQTSIETNIRMILPTLPNSNVTAFANNWINDYGSNAGQVFNNQTQLPQPFTYVIRTSLISILTKQNLISLYPPGSNIFETLLNYCWSHLTPWSNTLNTLEILSKYYLIGALSNGDTVTLRNITNIFLPTVSFSYIFSSDYPIGAFKPNIRIYNQLLQVGFNINEIVHIAGSATDASGARAAGLFGGLLRDSPSGGVNKPCFSFPDITYLPAFFNISTASPSPNYPSATATSTFTATSTSTLSRIVSYSATMSASSSASASASSTSVVSSNTTNFPNVVTVSSTPASANNNNNNNGPTIPPDGLSSGTIAGLCIAFFIGGMLVTVGFLRSCGTSQSTFTKYVFHSTNNNPFHNISQQNSSINVSNNNSNNNINVNNTIKQPIEIDNVQNPIQLQISSLSKK